MSRDRLERLIEAIENPVVEQNGHSAYYIPHDVAKWFPGAARSLLNGDIRALGLFRSPGRPVESNGRTVDLAEKALTAKMQGKTWAEINLMIFGQIVRTAGRTVYPNACRPIQTPGLGKAA